MWMIAPVASRQAAVARDMVGVVVGLEHVLDSNPVQAGKAQVWLDVPLRVDDGRDAGGDVADQVGGAPQILVDHLPEKHRALILSLSALSAFLTKDGRAMQRRQPRTLLSRLRDAAQRQHARLPGAEGNRGRRAPRGVLRGAAPHGRPRRPEEYFDGVDDRSILDHLGERGIGDEPRQRSPLWSRAAYDRYLEWAIESGTTPNGVFGAKLMWGYFGDFVSLLRNIPAYRDLPLAELLPAVFPDLTFVRVVRANKVRQAVSLWKAVQTATWRQEDARQGGGRASARHPPYKSFLARAPPAAALPLRRDRAPAEPDPDRGGALGRLLRAHPDQAGAGPVRELRRRLRERDPSVLERLGIEVPDGLELAPRMKKQSDGINDDWARRYADLKLGTEFDLVPSVPDGR